MDLATLEKLSLAVNDDGELSFTENTPEASADAGTEGNDKNAATPEGTGATVGQDGKPVVVAAQTPAAEVIDWEKRYKDLQADHTRSRQELSESRAAFASLKGEVQAIKDLVVGKQTPSAAQSEEDLLEALADRERAPKVLKELIEQGVARAMEATPEAKVQREFNDTRARIGSDFDAQLPVIKQLSSELAGMNVNFTFEQLYALSKMVPAASEKKADPPTPEAAAGQPQAGLTKEQANAIAAKAVALKTESGVSASPESKPTVNSVRSALDQALVELGYA